MIPSDCRKCAMSDICYFDETPCIGYEPKKLTNADRIRAMTDEELARFLSKSTACPAWADKSFCCRAEESCSLSADRCWVDWLKQEGKNDKH